MIGSEGRCAREDVKFKRCSQRSCFKISTRLLYNVDVVSTCNQPLESLTQIKQTSFSYTEVEGGREGAEFRRPPGN
jgi:hypothetical protein